MSKSDYYGQTIRYLCYLLMSKLGELSLGLCSAMYLIQSCLGFESHLPKGNWSCYVRLPVKERMLNRKQNLYRNVCLILLIIELLETCKKYYFYKQLSYAVSF